MKPAGVRRTRLMALVAALAAVLCAGMLALVQPAAAGTFVPIFGAGSTWAYPLIHSATANLSTSGPTVNYQPNGSASGREFFAGGQVDFAASDIPYGMQDGSSADLPPSRGYAYMPDAAGGVALMYNLSINGVQVTNLRLSGTVIAGIFTNQITMWNDPRIAADNPGLALPATRVTPVVRIDASGANEVFTQWLATTQSAAWTAYCQAVGLNPCGARTAYPVQPGTAMIGQPGDPGVPTYVAQSSFNGTIGITEYSWALAKGFPVAKVLNSAGYYTAPTAGNVGVSLLSAQLNTDGSANLTPIYTDTDPRTYELSYYSYLILPTDLSNNFTTDKGYTLGTFGSYLLCQEQQQVTTLSYAPLPLNLVENGYAALGKVPGAQLPATLSAFLSGCGNPTLTAGADNLASTAPQPAACDQEGNSQCGSTTTGTAGIVATKLTLTTVPSPPVGGQQLTLTATVTDVSVPGPTPTGSVTFSVGGTVIGSGPVTLDSSGTATVTTTLPAGFATVAATYTPALPSVFYGAETSTFLIVSTPTFTGTIPLATTVPPVGAFSLTVDSTDTVTLAVDGYNAAGTLTPVVVSDTRNTYPGWSVSGVMANFTGSGTAAGSAIAGGQLGWTPTAGPIGTGVTLGSAIAPAAPGLGTPAVLALAYAGNGYGTSTLGANLLLEFPAATPAGPYTGGLTITAVDSQP
jgi:phosphate ABC transporter phosphate-binding protein